MKTLLIGMVLMLSSTMASASKFNSDIFLFKYVSYFGETGLMGCEHSSDKLKDAAVALVSESVKGQEWRVRDQVVSEYLTVLYNPKIDATVMFFGTLDSCLKYSNIFNEEKRKLEGERL